MLDLYSVRDSVAETATGVTKIRNIETVIERIELFISALRTKGLRIWNWLFRLALVFRLTGGL